MLVKVPASLVGLSASQELDRAQSHLFDSLCSSREQPSTGAGLCSVPKCGLTLSSLLLYAGKLQRAFKFTPDLRHYGWRGGISLWSDR